MRKLLVNSLIKLMKVCNTQKRLFVFKFLTKKSSIIKCTLNTNPVKSECCLVAEWSALSQCLARVRQLHLATSLHMPNTTDHY